MKNETIIIIVIVAVLLLVYPTVKIKKVIDIKKEYQDNVKILRKVFPDWVLVEMEKIYRWETAHFKSGQFKNCYAPGMEKFGDEFPYGWNTINKVVWSKFPNAKPLKGVFYSGKEGKTSTDPGGTIKQFLVFPNLLAAMTTVAGFIQHYGKPERWYSTKEEAQQRYRAQLDKVKPRWTNEILT